MNILKHELQSILSGKSQISHGTLIQAITHYLDRGTPTSPMAKEGQQNKAQETSKLIAYIEQNELWIQTIDFDKFVSAGAEQRVFIQDERYVIKLNDTIYYASWRDYFCNLLLHNFFFPDTAYQFLGFFKVKQPFVRATHPTDLNKVKAFMEQNGFQNKRNHDYYNPKIGVILEDLHDENVLTQEGVLYFIDTVFYIQPEVFWN